MPDDLYNKVKSNDLDFVVDGAVPPDTIREYTTNPDLQSKINVYPSDALRYISFNFLVPPFDDIHVRKAFNWALDKSGMRQLRGGATTGEFAGLTGSVEVAESGDPGAPGQRARPCADRGGDRRSARAGAGVRVALARAFARAVGLGVRWTRRARAARPEPRHA